jgi:4-hydroxy-3-methylbut-2-enyl diphosphate reductase
LETTEELSEIPPGSVLLIRSHGAPKRVYDEATERGLQVVDATCPYVIKIQKLIQEVTTKGLSGLVVGDPNHPEVKGIIGWAQSQGLVDVIQNEQQAHEINNKYHIVVAQTTFEREKYETIAGILQEKNPGIQVKNTICNATRERQDSARDLARETDLMIVVGGKNSSNSKKLAEICEKYCPCTVFIENIQELSLKNLEKYSRIGVAAGASTPVSDIEEVIANMSEVITERNEMEDYLEAIEKSLRLPRLGEIVEGTVHQVTDKEVIVNLGCKKDGVIPKEELTLEADQKITDIFKEGDTVQAKVIKTDDGDGTIMLSKKKLQVNENWEEISQALDDKETIDVKVVRVVNGGVIASYKEVAGFIPLSQLSDRFVENAEEFMGHVLPVKISRVDKFKGKAVFSHKAYLAEERQSKMAEIWEKLSVGDVIEGTVMRFTDYGAFVDIGGIDGLLHISEISWGKLKHPQEVLSIGEKINVKVLSMNAERGKISLGLKQTQPEPWTVIDDKYQVGQLLVGKVVQIKEYGAFVELEPGLDGLVHISEVAHKRVTDLNDELKVGQEVNTKILEIDKEKKRISLSIKETLEPPIFEEQNEESEEGVEDMEENKSFMDQVKDKAEDLMEDAKEKIEELKDEAEDLMADAKVKADELTDDAKEKAEVFKDKAEDVIEDVKEKAEDVAEDVKEKVEKAKDEIEDAFDKEETE